MEQFEFFQFKKVGPFNRESQLVLLVLLYLGTIAGYWFQVQKTGKMDGYEPGVSIMFVAFYEEFMFRGLALKFFKRHYGKWIAISVTSFLFGIWHLKNIFWLPQPELIKQLLYTGLIFSPALCWITLKTRTLWPAVILHLLNNLPVG
jgi:membrane protease YdiL (CAAX protease family)